MIFRVLEEGLKFQILICMTSLESLIDDYGHHPVEISATIQAIRQKFPRKKICMIFEPHRYTRTQQLFNDFLLKSSQKLIAYYF